MSPTHPGLSVLVNDYYNNVPMQLLTGTATCSSVGLHVSKKHKLSGEVTSLEAFSRHLLILKYTENILNIK